MIATTPGQERRPQLGHISRGGDQALLDGADLLQLARRAGIHRLDQGALGFENEIAATLSRVIWQSANIARMEWRPPAADARRRWRKLAIAADSLLELLGQDAVDSLSLPSGILRESLGVQIVADFDKRMPVVLSGVQTISKLAWGYASQKQAGGAPRARAADWLFAGIAGTYERVAGEPPSSGPFRYSESEHSWRFAEAAIRLVCRRITERWLADLEPQTRSKQLATDPGLAAIFRLKRLRPQTLADRMQAGGVRWRASGGELRFTAGKKYAADEGSFHP